MSMFMDILNIPGESKSPVGNWRDKIEILSMGYDIMQPTSMQAGGGLLAAASSFGAMQITKAMDKSSPLLFGKLAGGEPIKTVILRCSRPGGSGTGPQGGLFEAETFTLTNVIVTSYHTGGAPGPGGLPVESWSLAFTAITELYNAVDAAGNLLPPQQAGYDIAAAHTQM